MRHGQGRAMNALAAALASTPGGAVQHPGGSVRWGGQQFSDSGSLVAWINQHGGHSDVTSFLGRHPGAASAFASGGQTGGRSTPKSGIEAALSGGPSPFTAPQGGLQHALGPPITQEPPPGQRPPPLFTPPPLVQPPDPTGGRPPVRHGPRLYGPPIRRGGIASALTL